MEEKARTLDLRPLLAVAAVVAVVLTMWVAGAFAAGGSSGSSDSPASDAPSMFIPTQDDGQQQAPSEDCPDDGAGGSGRLGGRPGFRLRFLRALAAHLTRAGPSGPGRAQSGSKGIENPTSRIALPGPWIRDDCSTRSSS